MKKLIIAAACAAVILGGTFGAYKINESRKSKKAVAKVTPVSLMTDSYWATNWSFRRDHLRKRSEGYA